MAHAGDARSRLRDPETSGSLGRVLLADDDPLVREALRDLLEDYGFDVVGEAGTGVEAVRLADERAPEVVLMDVRMPEMDGIRATMEIRRVHPEIQIVMLSAYDEEGFEREAEQIGALCYLVKGVGGRLLRDVLTSAVATARGVAARLTADDPA
ncbi:Chemotaxis protein CheY [bacterium HR12]|nr:Chemotaxis protein CheY [bacterium HR12]